MDRRSEEPTDTFWDVVSIASTTSAWSAFRYDPNMVPTGTPNKRNYESQLTAEFSNRLNVIWSRAVQVFVAWDVKLSDETTRGTLGDMKIKPSLFDFWSYGDSLTIEPGIAADVAAIKDDTTQNRMPIANLCMALGDAITTTTELEKAMQTVSSSPRTIAAHMVVYASWRIAACVAEKCKRGTDATGFLKVATFDLYAATVWACSVLCKEQQGLLVGTPDWNFDDVMMVLASELQSNSVLSSPNEAHLPVWMQVDVFGDLGYFIRLAQTTMAPLPGEIGKQSTFNFTTVTQAANAELILHTMSMMTMDSKNLTRVAYVPLFMKEIATDTAAYDAFQDIWLTWQRVPNPEETQDALFTLEQKYGTMVCGLDDETECALRVSRGENVFWDPATRTCRPRVPITPPTPEEECAKKTDHYWDGKDCLPIPDCGPGKKWDPATKTCVPDTPTPDPEADCNKRKAAGDPVEWDPVSKTCKSTTPTPSGGGGGGGGGGGSGPALFIGILALLALFGRR